MANASAKRIAAQNERAIRNLRIGMLVSTIFSLVLRFLLRRQSLTSISSILFYFLTFLPTLFLYSFLVRAGTPRRDASGTLITPGDDLNQAGLTDWSWDIIYVTWACQVCSSAFGSWVWWFYLIIPAYGGFKVWSSFISPMVFGRSSREAAADGEVMKESASKRQEKLRKRQEKGDPRVRAVPRKV